MAMLNNQMVSLWKMMIWMDFELIDEIDDRCHFKNSDIFWIILADIDFFSTNEHNMGGHLRIANRSCTPCALKVNGHQIQ